VTDLRVLQEGRAYRAARAERERRARRARRRQRAKLATIAAGLGIAALLIVMTATASDPPTLVKHEAAPRRLVATGPPQRTGYGIDLAPRRIDPRLRLALRSGVLFDVTSGRVLWRRDSMRVLPIASLTKMMTALIVATRAHAGAQVLITRQAVHFTGSGVGLLPLGKRVRLETLLYGLLLPSGNDAAIALAQHVAGNRAHFIGMMNSEARKLGLTCTHFTTVSGVVDQGNHSCATDLAILAHALLKHPLLRKIVGTSGAMLPFPIKGHKLYLYNNNPLLRAGFPGTDGVKTGFTTLAGECLVATAKRGRTWLGVVLLHSGNPLAQAETLLDAGFAAARP
jgi:D-alanyl-D-alanine carboxypeptidase (penicillin-binding protein 5/6)